MVGLLAITYVRQSLLRVGWAYGVSFAVLMVIFAIEKFDYVFRIAIEFGLPMRGFLVMFLSMLPAVMDTIVPIATLVALYLVLLQKRESRELLILAAAGCDSRPIATVISVVGLTTVALSLFSSGLIQPSARYAFRAGYERAVENFVSKGPPPGRFFRGGQNVLQARARPGETQPGIRIFGFEGARLDRIFVSDCSQMDVQNSQLHVKACEARVYHFRAPETNDATLRPDCLVCPDNDNRLEIMRLQGGASRYAFDMQAMFPTVERERIDELLMTDLLEVRDHGFASNDNARRATKNILFALVNILAVIIALCAVAFTGPRTRMLALPCAIAVLMAAAVLLGSGVLVPEVVTPTLLLALIGFTYPASLVAVWILPRLLNERLTSPRLVRK